jgi:cytochrome c peroxidase
MDPMISFVLLSGCLPPALTADEEAAIQVLTFDATAMPAGSDPIVNEQAAAALGERLYFEPGLSADGSVSCDTCHQLTEDPRSGADPRGDPTSEGAGGVTKRNAPTVLEVAYRSRFGWVGQFCELDDMSTFPLTSSIVYGHPTEAEAKAAVATWVRDHLGREWQEVFGTLSVDDDDALFEQVGLALEAHLRALPPITTGLDLFLSGDAELSASEMRGLQLYVGKAHCVDCHSGPLLSDELIHVTSVAGDDGGQAATDGTCIPDEPAEGGFVTPGMRSVALTAPYMHDGSLATLADVVRHYNEGGAPDEIVAGHPDPRVRELFLDEAEVADLVSFLETLGPR